MVDEDFEWQARRSNREFTHTVSSTIVNELTDDKTENARERTTGSPNSLKLEPPSRLSPASGSASRLGPPSRRFRVKRVTMYDYQMHPTASLLSAFLPHDDKEEFVFNNEFHRVVHKFVDSRTFSAFILLTILINTAMLIANTFFVVAVRTGWYFASVDTAFLGIYLMEIVLKIYVYRLNFFRDSWNNLDFWIVVFNIGDFITPFVLQNVSGFNGAAIFRLLRIFRAVRAIRALRVLRTIRFLSNLQVILTTVLQSIKSIGTVVMLITLFMYMFAVIGRGLYAHADPAHFGNLFYALFTLFQLLTLDDWFDIYLTVTRNDPGKSHVIVYLIVYIVVEYFIFLNLFVAVLVDNFQLTLEAQNVANAAAKQRENESDDEDDNGAHVTGSTESSISSGEVDIVKRRKPIQEYYPDMHKKDRDDLRRYFHILAALDHNQYMLANQHRVLDMMVLMCTEDATISD
ncbi:hypothetical protein NP493_126g03046 [Ridgeia piscesae]|uniref:Ion transport domain-containing protein n=1 Tax=Ridgeia piscesae TaxID=27915 RepID=A0AAD9P5X7_RIDPI|nr:hypothetical protein NP493_126g03046 [Ridgeia piscesae]